MEPCSKEKEIEKLLQVVYGNGDPGMKIDIAVIKQKIEDMPTPGQLKFYALVGSGISVMVGFGFQMFLKAVIHG